MGKSDAQTAVGEQLVPCSPGMFCWEHLPSADRERHVHAPEGAAQREARTTAPPGRLEHHHLAGDVARARERFELAGGVRDDHALGRQPILRNCRRTCRWAFARTQENRIPPACFGASPASAERRAPARQATEASARTKSARAARRMQDMTAGRANGEASGHREHAEQGSRRCIKIVRVCPALRRKRGKRPHTQGYLRGILDGPTLSQGARSPLSEAPIRACSAP